MRFGKEREGEEGMSSYHVLYTGMGFMHELKEFVDYRLQELPMSAKEPWVLSDYVHDVAGYDGLVVFAPLVLAESQQVLYHSD